jgi:hypothetical protein
MSKSKHLTTDMIRTVFRWVGDCRDLGADCAAWNRHAAECVRNHFDLPLVAVTCIPDFPRTPTKLNDNIWDVGTFTERERDEWGSWIFTEKFLQLTTPKSLLTISPNSHSIQTRRDIIGDKAWHRSLELNEARRPLGQDEFVASVLIHGPSDHMHCFSINRAVGEPGFSPREVAMIKLFHEELIAHFGTRLKMGTQTLFDKLPPRLQQVMTAMLEGDSEKQIALKLQLSTHTVHEHITRLYRRLGVHNRAELLALYYRMK